MYFRKKKTYIKSKGEVYVMRKLQDAYMYFLNNTRKLL